MYFFGRNMYFPERFSYFGAGSGVSLEEIHKSPEDLYISSSDLYR